MGYAKQIYARAAEILRQRREQAETQALMRKAQVLKVCPEIEEIERQMAQTGLAAVHAISAGEKAEEAVRALAVRNLELQEKRRELLAQHGFPADCLQPVYTCPVCSDTGAVNGHACACYNKLLRDLAYRELASESPLKLSDFNSFRLDVYDAVPNADGLIPREEMEAILRICQNYADTFSDKAQSLFMYGKTGLGKTHLSLAIAAAAIEKGYGVVYGSAQNLFGKLEKEHFGREPYSDTESLLEDCDLLILDDLGAEYTTGFIKAAVYNIVNTRLLCARPTILNSNLTFSELETRYSDRVTSRILGNYAVLHFVGRDMRIRLR